MSKRHLILAAALIALQCGPSHPQTKTLCDEPFDGGPAAMYERIRQLPGAAEPPILDLRFHVINLPGQVWNFTKEGHPAHPSVACRRIIKDGDALRVQTQLGCNGAKAACEQLAEDYRILDERMMEAIRQKQQQKQ